MYGVFLFLLRVQHSSWVWLNIQIKSELSASGRFFCLYSLCVTNKLTEISVLILIWSRDIATVIFIYFIPIERISRFKHGRPFIPASFRVYSDWIITDTFMRTRKNMLFLFYSLVYTDCTTSRDLQQIPRPLIIIVTGNLLLLATLW